ncbi:hypothetical protein KSS87_005806 [Heliosperma pusillum]|nr:hypothetical protein KSS87_005806 [Heliosperma pusillum]
MGLDNVLYGHVRSNLLMEDEIASLSRAYALILREERHRAVTKVKEETLEAAMAVQVTGSAGRGRGYDSTKNRDDTSIIRCTYCNKLWHTEDNCWDKPGYQGRGRGRGRNGGRWKGGRGRGGYTLQANAAAVNENDTQIQDFTTDEIVQIRSLLNAKAEERLCLQVHPNHRPRYKCSHAPIDTHKERYSLSYG